MNSRLNSRRIDNSSSWILCASKSFPGKFYYFNGTTGEKAWCGDGDKNLDRRDLNFHNSDNYNSYQQPSSPPGDFETSTPSFAYRFNPHPNPPIIPNPPIPQAATFGQVAYPGYVANPQYLPNIVWTPFHPPNPPIQPISFSTERRRRFFNQSTQTGENIYLPSSPPNFTFTPPTNPVIPSSNFSKTNPNIPPSFLNKNSKPVGTKTHNIENKQTNNITKRLEATDFTKLVFNEPLSKKLRLSKTTDMCSGEKVEFKPLFKKRICSYSDSTNASNYGEPAEESQMALDSRNELDNNDLRHVLVARRRKSVNSNETVQPSFLKVSNKPTQAESKKKVTFDVISVTDENNITTSSLGGNTPSPTLDIKHLSQLSETTNDIWYILPDLEVLLQHFDFLKQFVRDDPRCRIFIPLSLYKAIESQSVGDCRGRPHTMIARQLFRNIKSNGDIVSVQEQESGAVATNQTDDILSCCILLTQQNYHVVIITMDESLNDRAKSLFLFSFAITEILDNQKTDLPIFDLKKINAQACHIQKDEIVEHTPLLKNSTFYTNNLDGTENTFYKNNNNSQKVVFKTDPNVWRQLKEKHLSFQQSVINNETIESLNSEESEDLSGQFDFLNSKVGSHQKVDNQNKETHPKSNKENIISESQAENKPKRSIFDVSNSECSNNQSNYYSKNFFSGYSIEDGLRRFIVKSQVIKDRVKCRMEEWECSLFQIMEDALTDVLKNQSDTNRKLPPPWTLSEATEYLKRVYSKQPLVKSIVDGLSEMLADLCLSNGKLKSCVEADEFMRMFGCCVLLIQALQTVTPLCTLTTAESTLLDLLNLIHHPELDPDPKLLVASSSISIAQRSEDLSDRVVTSASCIKTPREVLDYLIQTFPQWKAYAEQMDEDNIVLELQKNKIIRTTGKDLKRIKITKNNNMTTQEITKNEPCPKENKVHQIKHTDLDKETSENATEELDSDLMWNIKFFLSILSRFVNALHDYIYNLMMACKTKSMSNMRQVSDETQSLVTPIIKLLKSIIQRESVSSSTESSVLVKAGLDANKYRQVISKCLEQIEILTQFLRFLLRQTNIEELLKLILFMGNI